MVVSSPYCVQVAALLLEAGKHGREPGLSSPLMYTWHEKHYLGAAHGLTGILTLLLQVQLLAMTCYTTRVSSPPPHTHTHTHTPLGTSVHFAPAPGLPGTALCGLSAGPAAAFRQPALFPGELTWRPPCALVPWSPRVCPPHGTCLQGKGKMV